MSELTPKKKSVIREYGEALFVALVVAAFIRLFLVSVFTIPSGSMLNTIQIGDYILVNKLSYGFKLPFSNTWIYKGDGPQYGDIIVFKYPKNPSVDYIKRVVGLPGDIVKCVINSFTATGRRWKKITLFKPVRIIMARLTTCRLSKCLRMNIFAWVTTGIIRKIPALGERSIVMKFTARLGEFTGLGTVKTIPCVLAAWEKN